MKAYGLRGKKWPPDGGKGGFEKKERKPRTGKDNAGKKQTKKEKSVKQGPQKDRQTLSI